jgi:hypothetical protein
MGSFVPTEEAPAAERRQPGSFGWLRDPRRRQAGRLAWLRSGPYAKLTCSEKPYSHSMVAGGLDDTS